MPWEGLLSVAWAMAILSPATPSDGRSTYSATLTRDSTNEPQELLADELIAHAPSGLTRAFCVTGRSEAREAANLAPQYHVEGN
jgi:hypothetical protein